MSYLRVLICFVVGVAAVSFSGCASNPNNAELMRDHRSNVQLEAQIESELKEKLAQDWDRGQKLIASGNKNLTDGEKRVNSAENELKKGKEQVELGNRELAEGRALVRNSERTFRESFSSDLELSRDL